MIVLGRRQQQQIVMGLDVEMVGGGGVEAVGKERKDSVGVRERDFGISGC